VLVAGAASVTAVFLALPHLPPPSDIPQPTGPGLIALFVFLAAAGELVSVRIWRGRTSEDLTFIEAVLVAALLTMPPSLALSATLAGLLVASVVQRRDLSKTLFNLGSYATSGALMTLVYYGLSQGNPRFSGQSVLALLLATLAFSLTNTSLLSLVFHVVAGTSPSVYVRDEWRLSATMAVGGVGVGMTAVFLATAGAWPLVPFVTIPIAAIWYAYGAAAQHAVARERNRWLVDLGGHLAGQHGSEESLASAAYAIQQIVGAPQSEILDPRVTVAAGQVRLLTSLAADPGPRALVGDELPAGWQTGVVTRLDLGGSEHGALLLGSTERYRPSRIAGRTRGWSLEEADAPVLGALVAAVGSSMRAGAAFATLTEERDKLTAVVDNTSDGIAMVDDAGRVRLWSQTMVRMTGVRPEDLGADLESAPSVVQVLVRAARSGSRAAGAPPVQVTLVRGDGETLDVSVTTTRVREATIGADAAEQGWVSILTVHDETRERRVERMKTDFIATVSHELRTPITPIKGYAHLLATRRDRLPADKVTEKLLLIASSADHLERLVDDLLMAQRVSGSANLRVEMAVHDLEDVVRQAVDGFPQLAGRISVAVPDHPVEIQCDRDRTVQCLANLIGNAEKYAPDSPVEISADVVGSHARIRVRDHGAGIPEAEREKVFARFYRREDPFTMRTGGAGLGLHIARELAESMGGGLTLEDPAQGNGAEFVLHLLTTDAPMVAYAAHGPEQSSSATGIRKGQAWRLPRSADAEGTSPDTTREGHEVIAHEPEDGTMGTSADQRAAI
jgi:signal transduction histidine kinase/cbb3-type cytochrome oxidase subunit 3